MTREKHSEALSTKMEFPMRKNTELEQIPVHTIATFPFRPDLFAIIQIILEGHGTTIERYAQKCVLRFPEGTYKSELLPRVRDSRYEVLLPDGYRLYEVIPRTGELSIVRLNLDDLPGEVQEQIEREQHS